jgi:shikimate kinase
VDRYGRHAEIPKQPESAACRDTTPVLSKIVLFVSTGRRGDLAAASDGCGRKLATVKRVLLTGMSGTGKSSVIQALAARGYKAVDTDDGWCEPLPDGRQRWREDAIEQLLATADAEVLFVAGCEENQVRFQPRFDVIILLSAPAEILAERLASRTGNPYGKTPGQLRRVFDDLRAVEPLLRQAADYEIRTTMPLDEVVAAVLRLIGA